MPPSAPSCQVECPCRLSITAVHPYHQTPRLSKSCCAEATESSHSFKERRFFRIRQSVFVGNKGGASVF